MLNVVLTSFFLLSKQYYIRYGSGIKEIKMGRDVRSCSLADNSDYGSSRFL